MDMEVLFKLIEGVKELQLIICIMNHSCQILRQNLGKILPVLLMPKERCHKLLQAHIRTNPCVNQHMLEEHINPRGHYIQEVLWYPDR